ncbi:hypothetical protein PL373_15990 [Tenacibaculum maritimum]|nr:hypothetical protein [Tenacibaculum maritimum]MDB0602603.1 hypothetical protein [Tenacibaculum maritimum]MDB0611285.1 hypothetical protein [Tenacibaculum maritimum]
MKTNINTNFVLKQTILDQISDTILIARISDATGLHFATLKRLVSLNHKNLTYYNVLITISELLNIPINELVEKSSL